MKAVKPLFVGEDYGHAEDRYRHPRYALSGKSGRVLADMAGVSLPRFLVLTERLNVCVYPHDWSQRSRVIEGASRVAANFGHRQIALLGAKVAHAMGLDDMDLFEVRDVNGAEVVRLPHPSGRNHLLNDSAIRTAMSEVVRALVCG